MEAAENSWGTLYQVEGCGLKRVVAGATDNWDAHRCFVQLADAQTGVDLGEDGVPDYHSHFLSLVMVSQHGSMRVSQVAVVGCPAIEAVEVWVVHFEGEVGSKLGKTAAASREAGPVIGLQRRLGSLGGVPSDMVEVGP